VARDCPAHPQGSQSGGGREVRELLFAADAAAAAAVTAAAAAVPPSTFYLAALVRQSPVSPYSAFPFCLGAAHSLGPISICPFTASGCCPALPCPAACRVWVQLDKPKKIAKRLIDFIRTGHPEGEEMEEGGSAFRANWCCIPLPFTKVPGWLRSATHQSTSVPAHLSTHALPACLPAWVLPSFASTCPQAACTRTASSSCCASSVMAPQSATWTST
jgi:hypothetical protein